MIGNLAAFGLRDLAQTAPVGMHAVVPGLAIPAFDPRLRLEVTVPESDVRRVVQVIQRIPGTSTYLQVIDASLTAAAGDGDGERGRDCPA